MVFHVGDVGYADDAVFHSLETAVQFLYEDAYNGYMNWIENITSSLAYHVTPGWPPIHSFKYHYLLDLKDHVRFRKP